MPGDSVLQSSANADCGLHLCARHQHRGTNERQSDRSELVSGVDFGAGATGDKGSYPGFPIRNMEQHVIGNQVGIAGGICLDALEAQFRTAELIQPPDFSSDVLVHILPEDDPHRSLRGKAGPNRSDGTDDGGIGIPSVSARGAKFPLLSQTK